MKANRDVVIEITVAVSSCHFKWLAYTINPDYDWCDPSHSIHFNIESIDSDATLLFIIGVHWDRLRWYLCCLHKKHRRSYVQVEKQTTSRNTI